MQYKSLHHVSLFTACRAKNYSLSVGVSGQHNLDLFIENTARVNFGNDYHFLQQKGLVGGAYKLNGQNITEIEIIPLEFKSAWVKR